MQKPKLVGLGVLLALAASVDAAHFKPVHCDGAYKLHLQGICTSQDSIFWCYTGDLVKTNPDGKIEKQISVPGHHGDLCYHDGKIYVAAFLREPERTKGEPVSWVYIYDAADLAFVTRHSVIEAIHRAGGVAYHDNRSSSSGARLKTPSKTRFLNTIQSSPSSRNTFSTVDTPIWGFRPRLLATVIGGLAVTASREFYSRLMKSSRGLNESTSSAR